MQTQIYKLIDPRDDSIFYIGKTNHKDVRLRLNEHIYSRKRFKHKTATKIAKIISLGLRPTIETIFTVGNEWEEKEIKTIKAYRDSGHKLTNLAIGGGGAVGVISKKRIKIYQYTLDGVFVKEWKSIVDAKENGFLGVNSALKNKTLHCGGYQWLYHKYKNISSISVKKRKMLPIIQFSLNGTFIKEWENQTEACSNTHFKYPSISSALSGNQKTAYGYVWKHKEMK